MKKWVATVLTLLLLMSLASCAKEHTSTPTIPTESVPEPPAVTEAPTDPATTESEWETGIARAGCGELIWRTFARGTILNVTGVWKDYYIVEEGNVDLLVEKRFIRLAAEEPFETWDGYARNRTKVFVNVYLEGEVFAELIGNQKVKVLDGGDDWMYIEWEGDRGYVHPDDISPLSLTSGGSDDNNSNSSGGDINLDLLAYYGPEMNEAEDTGLILAGDVNGIIAITGRGDELKVISEVGDLCKIYLDGYTAVVPRWLIRMEDDENYESWTVYTSTGAVVFEEYQLRNEIMQLNRNTKVTVIDELPNCYVVDLNGQIGYMKLNSLKATR